MSEGERIARVLALSMANEVIRILRPVCERIETAGSLRRGKQDVGDIEIVCIPREQSDLLGNAYRSAEQISSVLWSNGYALAKDGERYKQIYLPHGKCDLFITSPECWGVIFMLRTGSADFSHKMVTPKQYGGYMPSYLKVKDGRIWHVDSVQETTEEQDVFALYGMTYLEPEKRI